MRNLFLVAVMGCASLSAWAQKFEAGLKAGASLATFRVNTHASIYTKDFEKIDIRFDPKPGFQIGVVLMYHLNSHFSVQMEPRGAYWGASETSTDINGMQFDKDKTGTRYTSVQAPLSVKYNFRETMKSHKPFVTLGYGFNYMLATKYTFKNTYGSSSFNHKEETGSGFFTASYGWDVNAKSGKRYSCALEFNCDPGTTSRKIPSSFIQSYLPVRYYLVAFSATYYL